MIRSSALSLALGYVALGITALVLFAAPLWYAWRVTIQEGRNEILQSDAQRLTEEAAAIAAAGAFMLVLEHIPDELARRITAALAIPTIGIGAGPACDGQVLVINDAIGLGERWPPFSRQYAYAGRLIVEAAATFARQVRERGY